MGIFDEIVQNIQKEVVRVQDKSQEMIKVYSLNSQIRVLEERINANLMELGQLIYDEYEHSKEANDELLKEKSQQIGSWEKELKTLQAELEAMRVQNDPDRSASQKADAKAGYTPTPGFTCPHCQAPANASKSFCPSCGGNLNEASS